MKDHIVIKGAREHNLKNIDINIPRNQLVVITGLSGSGKSSLAFDTIYAEGQRRYIESLSAYARQFLGQLEKPDVDSIEGLSPAIAIEQKTTNKNPRSTVGTITEIYDYLRLVFARIGEAHCWKCKEKLQVQSLDHVVEHILNLPEKTSSSKIKLEIMAPLARSKKGTFKEIFEKLLKEGFLRVRIDGIIHILDEPIHLVKNKKHDIDLVIERLVLNKESKNDADFTSRLTESIELAFNQGKNQFFIVKDGKEEEFFSINLYCPKCDISFPEINHRLFSFNSPEGACLNCNGIGSDLEFHSDFLIKNNDITLEKGIINGLGWSGDGFWYKSIIKGLAEKYDFKLDTPWKDLPKKIKRIFLHGSGDDTINMHWEGNGRSIKIKKSFEGIIPNLTRRYQTTKSEYQKKLMEEFMIFSSCTTCQGHRLNQAALNVLIKGKNIANVSSMSLENILIFLNHIEFSKTEQEIIEQAFKEIISRLSFLNNVGVGYLTLDRIAGSLSGGEAQRIRLATQIGSALTGVLYVLDEPSIGLHQSDNDKLISTLIDLKKLGNSVLVVEHDQDTISASDYIIDMGPGAGLHGGYVTFAGTYDMLKKSDSSLTGMYLNNIKKIDIPEKRRVGNGNFIQLYKASENNLKNINLKIPLGTLTCITGLSGSGKSTLVNDVLFKNLMKYLHNSQLVGGKVQKIKGYEHIDKVIYIDQSPIGRTPRSNPVTYTGIFTPIRELFSQLKASRMRAYKPGRFSFNVPGGRCDACDGDGIKKIEMHFLADVFIKCKICKGKRYNRETLEVKYKNLSIADVLELRIEKAVSFFEDIPAISSKLKYLLRVGLGYLKLGQPSTTLSGGEAQRIKLSTELSKRSTGKTLYILDEPTTGLHFEDVNNLLKILHTFVDNLNTVVIIEHNMDVIKTADWIIDLGPGGGDKGGNIVAEGTPENIVKKQDSITGKFLKRWM